MYKFSNLKLITLIAISVTLFTNCISTDKLNEIGKEPNFKSSPVIDEVQLYPRTRSDIPNFIQSQDNPEKPKQITQNQVNNNGSLWLASNKDFFNRVNYKNIGDIIKVKIKISDKADLDNSTTTTRNSKESTKAPSLMGFEDTLKKFMPDKVDFSQLVSLTGANNNSGTGQISRKEKIEAQIAAIVTNIMPNGNLVIQGSQEIRVNYEIRELTIQGIVNPKDLTAADQVNLEQIAEARISYGGRGHITNVQQPRIGTQIIDAVSPF